MNLLERVRAGESLADLGVVDMHGHMGRYFFGIPDLSAATLVRTMDRVGVLKIIVSHITCVAHDTAFGNDEVAKAVSEFPDRIGGYGVFFPTTAEAIRVEAERCLDMGLVGFKLHNVDGFPYSHPAYRPLYELANAGRRPMLFHTWGLEPEMGDLDRLADRYPNAVLLLGHSGSNNVEEYIRLARTRPNIYLEICFSQSPPGMVKRLVDEAGAEKVVFGSDVYFMSLAHQVGKVASARLSEEEARLVLSGNARRILDNVKAW